MAIISESGRPRPTSARFKIPAQDTIPEIMAFICQIAIHIVAFYCSPRHEFAEKTALAGCVRASALPCADIPRGECEPYRAAFREWKPPRCFPPRASNGKRRSCQTFNVIAFEEDMALQLLRANESGYFSETTQQYAVSNKERDWPERKRHRTEQIT
jgi:hypothetical protein